MGLLGKLGQVVGAVGGFIAGGPVGAFKGAQIGGALGSAVDAKSSKATQNTGSIFANQTTKPAITQSDLIMMAVPKEIAATVAKLSTLA